MNSECQKHVIQLKNPQELGVQSWSPFATRKSGHIWRIWAEMTQTLMPKSTRVAQIHLPECNSAKIRQISAKFPPKFAKICQISAKIRQISQVSFHKRALTLNTQQELISPNMSSQFQLENSPELISYFNWEMSIGQFSGNSPWVLCWGVPQVSGGQISTKKILRTNF